MKLKKAVVFSENISDVSSLCAGATAFADETVIIAVCAKADVDTLLPYANEVIWLGEKAEGAMIEHYVPALAGIISKLAPELILTGQSSRNRCIAARLAVRLEAGVVSDISSAEISEDGAFTMKRNVYGGTAEATIKPEGTVIVIAPEGVFGDPIAANAGKLTETVVALDNCGIERLSITATKEDKVNLSAAKRVVGVGRGVGTEDNLKVVEGFAEKIGAELACTRPLAEEEHWMARNRYVGVSGVSIRPDVYFACGISGQIQHMVGVTDAKVIIAINKDAKSSIFENCDYGIVGDMNKIIPALAELF